MNMTDLYPTRWLKASDLRGHTVSAVIDRVELEDLGGGEKPVVYFQGKDKGLVCNRTNAEAIAAALGPETDDWTGGKVTLFATKVNFKGQTVDAIRLTCTKPKPKPVPTREPGQDADDFPF